MAECVVDACLYHGKSIEIGSGDYFFIDPSQHVCNRVGNGSFRRFKTQSKYKRFHEIKEVFCWVMVSDKVIATGYR